MYETVNVVRSLLSKIDVGVDVTDVVRLSIVIPCNYFDNVGFDLNSLFPTVIPQCVTEFYPVILRVDVLELPRRDACIQ